MKRPDVTQESLTFAFGVVKAKLEARLKEKGPGIFASRHETYGILSEELNKEILEALQANDQLKFDQEVVDLAVGCVFHLASARQGGMDW